MRLALSWLTVLPVHVSTVDARSARRAITSAPLVGTLLGLFTAAALYGLSHTNAPPLLAGFLVVGGLALATRGMHLDGLADTADGLGCYGPPERALEVMRQGGAGPFAVVALIVVLGGQAAALPAVSWTAVVLALTTGRAAFVLCCLQGVPAARPEGLGALVAGTQSRAVAITWWLVLTAAGYFVHPWHGPAAVVLAGALVLLLVRHTRRRFGGITGDVLGAACETASLTVLAVCSLA
ncbi:adenosylcobinamide-GDP ribazoletransferase [Actinosynnema sp. NPDC047251]|uniref:Adenosylcobinamide-GDP ribazoletransferase n=1 Tax=Saccharothrix espanaensis (strain ATCC 51144 / DSM 44229 / JCM 9112 / NBRC 15066 / NRRL 15764) TaxID=1179773 RepID=K0JTS2_SACES|nr:adenosylcobinamide-GDP ribazoletransferase [Saccharothrix espanaensis]CCH28927.1 Cobalamin 5'-phosphate synthase [Saccharothrix espanaensis DSM 44229]